MEKLNIPKKIHVGFQERSGTYTGKLSYIIYTDQKGKIRKERSWDGWRDHKISPEDYDNVPTSGFVLNKGVGGVRGSWSSNTRNEYIRIYDPRDFEFEISVANLLFILQECDAFKGKGLDGDFVYGWDGTELVLLPISCQEYTKSVEFTEVQGKKVTKKDMEEGRVYQDRQLDKLVYLGRHVARNLDKQYGRERLRGLLREKGDKFHIFYDIKRKEFRFEKGFTKLSVKTDEDFDDYANTYTKFKDSGYCSDAAEIVLHKISHARVIDSYTRDKAFLAKNEDGYMLLRRYVGRDYRYTLYTQQQPANPFYKILLDKIPYIRLKENFMSVYDMAYDTNYWNIRDHTGRELSEADVTKLEIFTPKLKLVSGTEEDIYDFI